MTEKKNTMTVLGVYEDLTYKDSHMVADDTFQTLKYIELLEQGYEPVGAITKDSTPEDIDKMIADMAEKITPAKDDPIWDALARKIYVEMSPHNRCIVSIVNREAVQKFEDELAAYVANGGDENEFCLAYLDEVQKDWTGDGASLEEEARRREL
jgi:hypothetical protein